MNAVKTKQNIPKGWLKTTIASECDLLRGRGLSKSDIDPLGKNKCLLYGELFTKYGEIIREVESRTNSKEGVKSEKGDVLIPGSTTTVAKDLAIASSLQESDVLLGGDINILRQKKSSYDPNFLAYYLTHHKNKELSSYAQGITIIHLSINKFKDLEICIPESTNEQKKIVEILGTVDGEIQKTDEIIFATEKLKRGLMAKIFTPSTGWKKVAIKDIGEIVTGTTPRTAKKENYGGEFIWVSPRDIVGQKYISESTKMLSTEGFAQTRKLPAGSVLVVCIGSTIGKVGIATKELSTNQQINSVIVNDKNDNEFIYYALLFNKARILEKAATQAVPIINKSTFSNINISVPADKNEQRTIAATLSSLDEKVAVNRKLKAKLTTLKKGLMQDLLSGSKRVKI